MSAPASESDSVEKPEARIGETLEGRYRIDSVLGVGAMGAVYRARHLALRKDVAVKLLHRAMNTNAEVVARFDREAAGASRLDHPNCVRVMDFGRTESGYNFLVMELLEGHDIASMIQNSSLPARRVIEIATQAFAGLDHAHKSGIIHRDIKPENIFVTRGSEGKETIKIVDFGIAKVQYGEGSKTLTKAGMVFGTPQYMSPEQALGREADARSDLYAMGLVMHAMLTGELPFDGDDPIEILKRQIKAEPPPLPATVPQALRTFLTKILAKNPDERFPNASVARSVLLEAGGGKPEPKRAGTAAMISPPTKGEGPPPPPKVPKPPKVPGVPAASSKGKDDDKGKPRGEDQAKPKGEDQAKAKGEDQAKAKEKPKPAVEAKPSARAPKNEAPAATLAPAPMDRARVLLDRIPPQWRMPAAAGAGALLIAIIVAAWSSGDDDAPQDGKTAASSADDDGEAGPSETSPAGKGGEPRGDGGEGDTIIVEDEGGEGEGKPEDDGERRLRANLAAVDALIEAGKYDAAKITLGPLLQADENEPDLFVRLGRVNMRLKGNAKDRAGALEAFRSALALDEDQLDNEAFAADFYSLLDDPGFRPRATEIAIELLGESGHDRLATWLNVQKNPLPYPQRHQAIAHLESVGKGKWVNVPLQQALDLWQADQADDPCAAFDAALQSVSDTLDSYLLGTVNTVPVPATGPGGEQCPGAVAKLDALQVTYTERFAGMAPIVPAEFRKRRGR